MIDHDSQKQLLKEIVEHSKALDIAIQMEMGAQNQQKINQNLALTTNSVNAANIFQTRKFKPATFQTRKANYQSARKNFTRYPSVPQNYQYTSVCTNSGQRWSYNHKQICHAKGKRCNNCGIIGHFAM